jgi:hypothetical protein
LFRSENISTPREMMQLLEQLYRGKVIAPPLLDDFFTVLATTKDSWIPRDLPADLRIANKPGALEAVRNDSGIVFLKNRPYAICVMTAYLSNERAGEDAITRISSLAYGVFDRLSRASDLVGRGSTLGQDDPGLGGQRGSEYQGSRCHVARRGTVVNQRAALFSFQEPSHVGRTDFQLQSRGNTVERLDALACKLLAVLMQVNESRSDNEPAGMNDATAAQRLGRYAGNPAIADADVAHGIRACFGIHDLSAFEHNIKLLRGHRG